MIIYLDARFLTIVRDTFSEVSSHIIDIFVDNIPASKASQFVDFVDQIPGLEKECARFRVVILALVLS